MSIPRTIKEAAALIEKREASPVELAELFLERISAEDGKINSYITVWEEASPRGRQKGGKTDIRRKLSGPSPWSPDSA